MSDPVLQPSPASSSDDLLQWFFDNPEQALTTVQDNPSALEAALILQSGQVQLVEGAILNTTAFAVALLDSTGRVIERTPLFTEIGLIDSLDFAPSEKALERDGVVFRKMATDAGATLVAYARPEALDGWAFPKEWLEKMGPGSLLAILPHFRSSQSLEHACLALGLTLAETRIAVAAMKLGDIQAAAATIGISYQRARALVSGALKRTASSNMAELARKIADISIGLTPQSASHEALLMDIWGLSGRQIALSSLIADGLTRDQAARALRISPAVAKKEMSTVFETFGIRNALGLSIMLRQHVLVSLLARFSADIKELTDLHSEPLRFAYRGDGSRIAYSDHGPACGQPVFYFHSSMTSRPVPKAILRELKAIGCRVIAIDRPGFGLTDPAPHSQFEAAALDFQIVREKLGISRPLAVARGAAQAVLAIARLDPLALGGAVLINPDPRSPSSKARWGPLGAAKEMFFRNPQIIAPVARLLASRLTSDRLADWLAKSLKGSPADEKALTNPEVVSDYWRATRSLSTGRVTGYIAEQAALAKGADEPIRQVTWPWDIIIGEQDTLHRAEDVERYWQDVLPAASVTRLADAGRMLAFTHPQVIAQTIRKLRTS